MKVTAIVLSALISFSVTAQTQKPKEIKPKAKTCTNKIKQKVKTDSTKISTKNKNNITSRRYCPGCGLG